MQHDEHVEPALVAGVLCMEAEQTKSIAPEILVRASLLRQEAAAMDKAGGVPVSVDAITAKELEEAEQMVVDVKKEAEEQHIEVERLMDDILCEGEMMLKSLPETLSNSLLQVVAYTPRTDTDESTHQYSSNNNHVVGAIRTHILDSEEDTIFLAEALLGGQGLSASVVDAAILEEARSIARGMGATIITSQNEAVAEEQKLDLEHTTESPLGTMPTYEQAARKRAEEDEVRKKAEEDATAGARKRQDECLVSDWARIADVNERRTDELSQELAAAGAVAAEELVGEIIDAHILSEEFVRQVILEGLEDFAAEAAEKAYFEELEKEQAEAAQKAYFKDLEQEQAAAAADLVDEIIDANGKKEKGTQTRKLVTADSAVQSLTGLTPTDSCVQAGMEVQDKQVQDERQQEDAQTEMPSRPTSARLEMEWHFISAQELAGAVEADSQQILHETLETLIRDVEKGAAAEMALEDHQILSFRPQRRVLSAKFKREEPAFVRDYETKKVEEELREAEEAVADERKRHRMTELEALRARLAKMDQEEMELRIQLEKLPVVKVTTRIDESTGKMVKGPTHEYTRIPLEDELAMHLQEEAERAYQQQLEATIKAEDARRAVAEEAFLFEAAMAEVRLEAFRLQQRQEKERYSTERENETVKKAENSGLGIEREIKQGWVSVKRDGPSGGLIRRMYVLRNTAILSFADEERRGGCLNALGLERIDSFIKGQGCTLEIHPREGNTIVVHCGGIQTRDAWLTACDDTLKRFRLRASHDLMFVAQPEFKSPVSKAKQSDDKFWDSDRREQLRREVDFRRNAVSKARTEQARADKLLEQARAEHLRLENELRLRAGFPGAAKLDKDAQDRLCQVVVNAATVNIKDMESAVMIAKKKAEEESRRNIQEAQNSWLSKVLDAEKKVFGLNKELTVYKEMSLKDQGLLGLEDMYMNNDGNLFLTITDGMDREGTAARFGGTMRSDGMMSILQDLEMTSTAGTNISMKSRPVTSLNDGNIHVFVDGNKTVLLQKKSSGTTVTFLG